MGCKEKLALGHWYTSAIIGDAHKKTPVGDQSMRAFFRLAAILLALAGAGTSSMAQEGHPLKGSWIGTWENNEAHGEFVVVILDWDGERITGVINPGIDDIEIESATLNPEDWSVRIEAEAQARSGGNVSYVIEGTIQDLALPNRYITGTWRDQNGGGAFEIRRQ
jgi:hypothetical protein